jgi:hypothetical protein
LPISIHGDLHEDETQAVGIILIIILRMNWNCPKCSNEMGEYNAYCEYCKYNDNIEVYHPDPNYIREIRIGILVRSIADGVTGEEMTPQEELFKDLFIQSHDDESSLVRNMDAATLVQHIEDLSKIAYEANVRIRVAKQKQDENQREIRKAKLGFARNLEVDEGNADTEDIINTIRDRQKRMSKVERTLETLTKNTGISPAEAAKLMSAGLMLARTKSKILDDIKPENISRDGGGEADDSSVEVGQDSVENSKPFVNPFAKK